MAVTVTRNVPASAEVKAQDDAAVPLANRLTAVTGQVTVNPVDGPTTELRETPPAKLNVLERDTDTEALETPRLKLTGLTAEMEKSPTCTIPDAWRDAEPGEPVPLTVTA